MDAEIVGRAVSSKHLGLGRSVRVLIAEDDSVLRRFISAVLFKDGYEMEEVATGSDLLVRASRSNAAGQELDLIISDIRMPGLTGLEVLKALHSSQRPGGWHTPVILITAFGDPETHAEAERLGAVIFDKPFDINDLRLSAINMVSQVPPLGQSHVRAGKSTSRRRS